MPFRRALPLLLAASILPACVGTAPRRAPPRPASRPPTKASALRDGASGAPTTLRAFLDRAEDADLVVFGEHHDDAVGSRHELEVLEGLAEAKRPVALAMEFFERDQQADLDAYLAGKLPEAEFRERTARSKGYEKSHRPLVEWAKGHGVPVIAANAPRRLVTAYRKSALGYEEWKASLPEADRGLLPRTTEVLEDAYKERFLALMGPERGPRLFKAQALWDDAMAEAIADFRQAQPERRVMLVVGAFHARGRGGVVTKFLRRRPFDGVALLSMAHGRGHDLAVEPEDLGSADALLLVPPEAAAPPKATP
jgi:uncharacterized iron-regulated protein